VALVAVTVQDAGTRMDDDGPWLPAARIAASDWTDTCRERLSTAAVAGFAPADVTMDADGGPAVTEAGEQPRVSRDNAETRTAPELIVVTRRVILDSNPNVRIKGCGKSNATSVIMRPVTRLVARMLRETWTALCHGGAGRGADGHRHRVPAAHTCR
jgi:hypothetical protein